MAHGNVTVIAAQHHLGTFRHDMSGAVDSGVDGSLGTAVADGLDLLNGIGHLHEPSAAGEQLGLEIRTQSETHHRDIMLIHDGPKLIDLPFRQELALIHDDHIAAAGMAPQKA